MQQYDNPLEKFESLFKAFENKAREIVSKNHKKTFSTELTESTADFINEVLSVDYDNIYMASVALLVDDVFDICFAKNGYNDRKWNRFASITGYIGYCCQTPKNDNNTVFVLNGKLSMARENRLSQKELFVLDEKMHAFFVAPVSIGGNTVGSLQVSFSEEKTESDIEGIRNTLLWCAENLAWILLTEQSKHRATLDAVGAIARTLDIKNEYQANHSKNVAKLALHFLHEIVTNYHYIKRLFGGQDNFQGYTSIQVRLAALLHDTGKLIMSNESFEEVNNIEDYCKRQLHAYYTDMVLGYSPATKNISLMAAYHHEKRACSLGYPYGVEIIETMVVEQVISLADLIDSMARERPPKNGGDNKVKRLGFDEIIKKLGCPEIANRYTHELYLIFITILESYRKEKNHIGHEIKKLLGIEQENANPEQTTIQTKEEELSIVIKQVINNDSFPITNRWVSAMVIKVPDNFCSKQEFGCTDGEGIFYVAPPTFKEPEKNKEGKITKGGTIECGEDYFLEKSGCSHPITVKYKRSSINEKLYYAAFILPLSIPREVSYVICEKLFKINFVSSMSVAFCDKDLLYSGDNITRLKQALIESCQTKASRWQLLPASTFY